MLKIAICGIRGIPACYGGFETFAEELSTRLVKKGYDVTVYGRKHVIDYKEPKYKGVNIRLLWAPRNKYLETPVHSLICFLDLIGKGYDVLLVCNAANSPFLLIPKIFKIKTAVNVDGIERLRSKWNWLGKVWYRLGEKCSVLFADKVISDAKVIYDYYKDKYKTESLVIPYGCNRSEDLRVQKKILGKEIGWREEEVRLFSSLNISPHNYILYVSRLEPENNAHVVIEAHKALKNEGVDIPLVIVGDAPYANEYKEKLKKMAGSGVIFAGYRFNNDYKTLELGAKVYVQATEVGGTHPALVESMGFGNLIIANSTSENREVLLDSGLIYKKNDAMDLCLKLKRVLEDDALLKEFSLKALNRAQSVYDWDIITNQYEEIFKDLNKEKIRKDEK